jgi:hypothetical protein
MQTRSWSQWRRSWCADAAFVAFFVAQTSDGVFTYLGISVLGVRIEANPLIAWYVSTFGLGLALVTVKLFAITCGAVLHLTARHRTLAALTLLYIAVAVWPWTRVLVAVL